MNRFEKLSTHSSKTKPLLCFVRHDTHGRRIATQETTDTYIRALTQQIGRWHGNCLSSNASYTYFILPLASSLVHTAYCLSSAVPCLLPFAYCRLLDAWGLLCTTHCILQVAYCILPIAHCQQPDTQGPLPIGNFRL